MLPFPFLRSLKRTSFLSSLCLCAFSQAHSATPTTSTIGALDSAKATPSTSANVVHLHAKPLPPTLLSQLAPVAIKPPSEALDLDFEPVQKGVFDQNGVGIQERVNMPLRDKPLGKSSVPPLPHPEAIFADPFGITSYLRKRGIAFLVDNTNEFSGALTQPTKGYGLKKGSSNAGQFSFESDIDWETLAGIKGFATHAVTVSRYGIPASRMFGDNLNPSSEIYGSGGNVVIHLVYFYGEETLLNGRINIAGGRMSYLSDFSSNPLYCTFQNNSFCGNPKAAGDNYAHASYPDANWAFRIRVRPTQHTYFQTGVYFPQKGIYGNKQYRSGFKFNGSDISGQSIPIEAGWEPEFGKDKLLGHYKIGFGIDTADHTSNLYDVNGNYRAVTGDNSKIYHSAWSSWVLIDQMVMRHKTSDTLEGGLTLIGGAYFNQPRAATRSQFYEFGIVDTGFWAARPLDTIGFNYGYTRVSHSVTHNEELQQSLDQPLMNGSYGIQREGSVFEATYRIHVMRGITFAPDFQYFFNPGGQRNLRDAAMLGFKSHIQIF